MKHERYHELLVLSLYDELKDDERTLLAEHLAACPDCSSELSSLKQFHRVAAEYTPAVTPEELLHDARMNLRTILRAERTRRTGMGRALEMLQETFLPSYKTALAGAACFVLGLAVMYTLHSRQARPAPQQEVAAPASDRESFTPGDTRITNIRFLQNDPATGEVEFIFDAVKPVRIKGSVNSEAVQKVLAHAILNEENAGVRLRSINAVASLNTTDKEIRSAQISAMESYENPGVRKEAFNALRKYPMDVEMKQAFLHVLSVEKNPGLRIAAINYLDSAQVQGRALDADVMTVLRQTMKHDDNNYVRLLAKAAVEEVRQ
jgi:hypothetical protein